MSDREKICDILYYLVWQLGWDESFFASLGLVPRESIRINRFRIVGRHFWNTDDFDLFKGRSFSDYNVRLLNPKEYRLSCRLDHIYTNICDIKSSIPEQEYEDVLDRIITKADKINKGLEKEFGKKIQSVRERMDKLYGEE